jgi:hypothetical protein
MRETCPGRSTGLRRTTTALPVPCRNGCVCPGPERARSIEKACRQFGHTVLILSGCCQHTVSILFRRCLSLRTAESTRRDDPSIALSVQAPPSLAQRLLGSIVLPGLYSLSRDRKRRKKVVSSVMDRKREQIRPRSRNSKPTKTSMNTGLFTPDPGSPIIGFGTSWSRKSRNTLDFGTNGTNSFGSPKNQPDKPKFDHRERSSNKPHHEHSATIRIVFYRIGREEWPRLADPSDGRLAPPADVAQFADFGHQSVTRLPRFGG